MQDNTKTQHYFSEDTGIFIAGATDTGRKRTANQDCFAIPSFAPESEGLTITAILADGMGGHLGGEIASAVAVEAVGQHFSDVSSDTDSEIIISALKRAVTQANQTIRERAIVDNLQGMGTTLTAATVSKTKAFIANVGDSRAYLLRNGTLSQITDDHSLVGELVRMGSISAEEAELHPQRNVLTRALGTQPKVEVDVFQEELLPGDILLLCSDGLYPMVPRDVICKTLIRYDPAEACHKLIQDANDAGGPDNITTVIIKIPGATDSTCSDTVETNPRKGFVRRLRDWVKQIFR